MPLVERSGKGFITGGVIDDTPDWLGSYNEGMNAALDQTTARLGQQEARQRMGMSAAEEARRAQEWDWKTQDRAREEAAWGAVDPTLPGMVQPKGPGLGLMDPLNLPAPAAPSPGLMEQGAVPAAPGGNGAITADQRLQMLPEWARLEQEQNLPPNFLETISMLESSGGTNTGNGQYTGVFQIGPQVAADFGVTPEQLRDPRVNAMVAAKLAGRNARQLREVLGREPQPWEIYLAHQQGLGGAAALLRNPTMSAIDALTQAYGGDRSRAQQAVVQNGGNPQMTAGEFAQKWAQKFGGALPQPFTGGPSVPTAPPKNAGLQFTPDPNALPVDNMLNDERAQRARRQMYDGIILQLRESPLRGVYDFFFSDQATADQNAAQSGVRAEALQWYQSTAVGDFFNANPGALEQAAKDPIAFYQKYNASIGGATSGEVSPKGDLPAGLQTAGPQPAPAAPAADVPSATSGAPGIAVPAPEPSGDVVPRVSRDEAGLVQPGQGSLATQIMRTPAGQRTTLPDMGPYIVEPAKIQADKFELQRARQLLEQQYAEAVRFRDRAAMNEIRGKAAEIDAATRLMTNMEAIAAMQAGNDNVMAQQLSRLSNGQLRLQPVTPNGTYNVFYGGKMVYQNVTKNALIAALRSEFDAQYQAQVAAATERAYAREDKILESQLKISEGLSNREADMIKQINIDAAKAAVERANPEYQIDVADDGTVTATPKTGGGAPTKYMLKPVTGVDGQPIMEADGQPKLKLVPLGVSGNTVPVQ